MSFVLWSARESFLRSTWSSAFDKQPIMRGAAHLSPEPMKRWSLLQLLEDLYAIGM